MDEPGGSLRGLTVVVTRPAGQASALTSLLEQHGARTVTMPLIEIVDGASDDEVGAALARLGAGDWIVVTSVHAAARVAPLVGRSPARVAAIGATTAAALPRTDLVPAEQSAAGLVAEMPPAPDGGRVVVAQAAGGAPTLVDGLRRLGWDVSRVDTHESRPVVPDARQQLAALRADVVVFTSGSQARAWVATFGTTTPANVVALGQQTARDAARSGLKVDVVAADHSMSGVVQVLQGIVKP